MKLLKLLTIVLILVVAGCTDDSEDTNNIVSEEMLTEDIISDEYLKCGRWGGTVTFPTFGHLTATPDPDLGPLDCVPPDVNLELPVGGNLTGFCSTVGRLCEGSTYVRTECAFTYPVPPEGPEIFSKGTGVVVGWLGHELFVETYSWAYPYTKTLTGYIEITGGTGIFEGATGHIEMLNGVLNEDGSGSWDEWGEIILIVKRHRRR